ncbi:MULTISPECIES: chaperone modulator CbpM [Desulfovibrio]|uniref:Chaperone modulatory protein CbpM n=3 Tax=Desulfovibrio TaxID=872 RepID=A0AA94L1Z3_DESDE|nr:MULTISPECIES: chaperone modulator CbpM [Desulfovibrio]ATD81916.1 MerR family transcriptional regulator [Desulfovibrio sp. G11]MDY0204525.1 chaperone modulator CbpM [Desulfovibrio desulfuricans]SFW41232.1 chaperone modulatory protein CbpM [Desulfovibrio desulfuricans]SPD34662.1 MerR HTH family regulatory protein [Desulfovibrio sp. G11]
MSMTPKHPTLPAPSTVMVWEEFVQVTGVDPERLQELLALGWIEARGNTARRHLFRDADIYRVRKLERICCDFELPVLGGTIIVDLLERIDALEQAVRSLKHFED